MTNTLGRIIVNQTSNVKNRIPFDTLSHLSCTIPTILADRCTGDFIVIMKHLTDLYQSAKEWRDETLLYTSKPQGVVGTTSFSEATSKELDINNSTDTFAGIDIAQVLRLSNDPILSKVRECRNIFQLSRSIICKF